MTRVFFSICVPICFALIVWGVDNPNIGREVAVVRHLQDGEELSLPVTKLIKHGEKLFTANFTIEEGAGRPLTKGTGANLSDSSGALTFPRNFNRLSGPEANSCSGCHNEPLVGGGGDRVTEVFVLGQRFDFVTFDHNDTTSTKESVDERGVFVTHNDHAASGSEEFANERKTIGMFGSGFIEMLARQMTTDLQSIRDSLRPGGQRALTSKGILFGFISRTMKGDWDTSKVEGLPAPSLISIGSDHPPSLIIMPFSQAGATISLRQFSNNAFNQHHGMQAEERFGIGVDADGDGLTNELTTADITAVTLYQATLAVPGRVMSNDPQVRAAEVHGEALFTKIGCSSCHVPSLPLTKDGWIYTEPNPYNPAGNLQTDAPGYPIKVDLTDDKLPSPRLRVSNGVVMVPAFTDLKIHDITTGPDDPNAEALDQNQPVSGDNFFAGNGKFITKKLWGFANSGPFMHHGKFTTIRESILAHSGEALSTRIAFQSLSSYDQGSIVEFLKTLQILPKGTRDLTIVQRIDSDE
jgi:hypothetical protein